MDRAGQVPVVVAGKTEVRVHFTLENLPTLIDRAVFPGLQGGPHMNKIMAIAVALREAATPEFQEYSRQILRNAKALAKGLLNHGCRLVTNGTDNHLMVLDAVASFGKNGQELQEQLEAVGIIETKGFNASVEGTDRALKTSRVFFVGWHKIGAALCASIVQGDVAAVRSAVDAGGAAARSAGELIATHVIPRPDGAAEQVVPPAPKRK